MKSFLIHDLYKQILNNFQKIKKIDLKSNNI